jgi:hypothetical protein
MGPRVREDDGTPRHYDTNNYDTIKTARSKMVILFQQLK